MENIEKEWTTEKTHSQINAWSKHMWKHTHFWSWSKAYKLLRKQKCNNKEKKVETK